ncbi:MAG: amidase, partial [Variovorax sp.]|nr:amidase [Variovorax sp.]
MTADTARPLHDWSAADLSDAYRAGTLSPVDATQAVIDHIERWEPALQATYLYRPEAALAQARASEARWQRGEAHGPLHG